MKVKMKVGLSGSLNGVPYPPRGEEWEVPDAVGAKLCSAGLADPIAKRDATKVEKAVAPEAEERESGLTTRRGPGRPPKPKE